MWVDVYRFIFIKDFKNLYGQVIIPKETSGTLVFDGCKVHISCDTIISEQGTAWFTVKYDDLKHCVMLESTNAERSNPD